MKLLADENIDASVISLHRQAGHEILAVSEMEPGISDQLVLGMANKEGSKLVTEDKDFGELAFRQNLLHHGVILLRLAGMPAANKAALLLNLLEHHAGELQGSFVVLSPGQIRIRQANRAPDA
jgi:predicted nuclease of predicted toxin-antitoxin system